jgi:ribosomal protein S6E (S10)
MEQAEGIGLKRLLLGYGKGMKRKPKREGKKKLSNHNPKGLKLRKTVRGNTITDDFSQINLKVTKSGSKTLEEIFNPKVEEAPAEEEKKE